MVKKSTVFYSPSGLGICRLGLAGGRLDGRLLCVPLRLLLVEDLGRHVRAPSGLEHVLAHVVGHGRPLHLLDPLLLLLGPAVGGGAPAADVLKLLLQVLLVALPILVELDALKQGKETYEGRLQTPSVH